MTRQPQLAKTYSPHDVEAQVAKRWDAAKAFAADPASPGKPFSIVIPPPNVTAALHLGHALNNTLQDVLVRYHRMLGDNAVWLPGTDHAGIATQTVVEKRVLEQEGKKRTDFARADFVAKIQSWKDEYEQRITEQLQQMGCSCDWDRQAFTLDEVRAKAVREAFFKLFKDGLIYRGKRLVNWDPATQTALADDEVEMQEIDGNFYYLRYPLIGPALSDGSNYVTVATTRPETMLGDTAVAVNPADPRAAELRGRLVLLPIVNREIPIIEDEYVVLANPDSNDAKARYASGFLKVTPAHDPNDWEIGQRHKLAVINVLGPDATISKDHGWPADDWHATNDAGFLLGMDRFAARKAVVAFFKEHKMLGEIKPYRHAVGHSYRSHVPIEPYLSDQWYVKVTDDRLAGAALRAMAKDQRSPSEGCVWKEGGSFDELKIKNSELKIPAELRFNPPRYAKTFQTWHENLRDWCISRQLWWGHRIPVWSAAETYPHFQELTEDKPVPMEFVTKLEEWRLESRVALYQRDIAELEQATDKEYASGKFNLDFICVRDPDDHEVISYIEKIGYQQDPDVLDTWFSSALWPMSTMGWPEKTPELETWNPTSVLCTAREIITLWVSRMVMFNTYFLGRLPFHDVFIHAMIQDGFGQKMSKSLGNGVDPMDIIHSHGSDAMRFTLTSMTTHTQDVRMPVDMICPFTSKTFTPKFITGPRGYKVAAPTQPCPDDGAKTMVSSYGQATGKAEATEQTPLARNTSEKFDLGQRFANKMWNAVRFSLTNLTRPQEFDSSLSPQAIPGASLNTADRWILSRLAQTVSGANKALGDYQFAGYAQGLYDFFWRDLCDWYIEAVKPTVQDNAAQQQVLASCIDVSLRLLHPIMPFVTEELWSALNDVYPQRGLTGLTTPASELLINATWPQADSSLLDDDAEADFELIQQMVAAVREVRTQHNVPQRQVVECTSNAPAALAQRVLALRPITQTLGNILGRGIGPDVDRPDNAAVAVVAGIEIYYHGLGDSDAERSRLEKRAGELTGQIKNLEGRLANKKYISKAPANLVQQTRDQLTTAQKEAEAISKQLATLG